MGWAWKSLGPNGGNSDDGEGRDAEERAADASRKTSWWDQFEDDSTKFTDDSLDSFSYKGAFDDSDAAWYRKSSFRYGGYRDYSPSSLFRSSFSGFRSAYYYDTSGDNAAKNKAIRALRTLTRNANTIANATDKVTYAVQFSAGADSNGMAADLAGGKNRTIYVSPDTVVNTTTTDEEDAAIDALTGFVLLRVQIAQDVSENVVIDINKTALHALPHELAKIIYKNDDLTKLDAKATASTLIDAYSAGMLAKSMITRLSRRAVVEDWGGFAPYFVRHAKQFARVKEKLLENKQSVEILCAQLAYNMLADENEITIPPEIAEIAAKHLGEKLPAEHILTACADLVAEIRLYMSSKADETPAGNIENAVADLLQEIVDEKNSASAGAEEARQMREQLGKVADCVDAAIENTTEQVEAMTSPAYALEQQSNEMQSLRNLDRLITGIKARVKILKEHADTITDAPWRKTGIQNEVMSLIRHFAQAVADAETRGVKAAPVEFGVTKENLLAGAEQLEKYTKELSKLLRQDRAEAKKKIEAIAAAALEQLKARKEKFEQLQADCAKRGDELKAAAATLPKMKPVARYLQDLQKSIAMREEYAKSAAEAIEKNIQPKLDAASTAARLATVLAELQREVANHNGRANTHPTYDAHYTSYGDAATDEFKMAAVRAAHSEGHNPSWKEWRENAIDRFINGEKPSTKTLSALLADKATDGRLDDIIKSLSGPSRDDLPDELESFSDEKREKLSNIAKSLGMTPEALLDLLQQLTQAERDNIADKSDIAQEAEKIGERLKREIIEALKAISPVDGELFGEQIQKKTTALDGTSLSHVNEEAQHAAEEDYVAYLSHAEAKPTLSVRPKKAKGSPNGRKLARDIVTRSRGAIERMRNALQFHSSKRTGEIYGARSGDLDEGSLHKLRYDSEHIWTQKTITKLPDVAVGILVDQSGSMSGSKIAEAREMCILLAEALKKVEGMHLHVYGHTANMNSQEDLVLFEHYSSYGDAANADLTNLGDINAFQNNYDGYAIKETAKLLNKDPAKRKYLFVIADGLPHGNGYAGDDAAKHVKSVCSFVRTRLKMPVYAFAVGVPEYNREKFKAQYGANNVVFLNNVIACLPQIVRFLRNTLQKEKSLVSVSPD